ncbi:thioredoxin family protein [Gimesia maris]|uniref:thioredoxin family protein n=1 Tax=Planctomycetia TaxID=203683 RepID=UPI003A934F12
MPLREEFVRSGSWLFCWPSYLPFAWLPLTLIAAIHRERIRPIQTLAIAVVAALPIGCGQDHESMKDDHAATDGIDPVQLTDANFEQQVLQSELPVLVDMWVPWCPPCIAMKPTIRQLANDLRGDVKVAELNVDENPFLKEKYEVRRYPTVLVFVDGNVVIRLEESQTKETLVQTLAPFIDEVQP